MFPEEQRKFWLILGGAFVLFTLIIVAVIVLDVRGLVQTNRAALDDAVNHLIPVQPLAYDEAGYPIFEDEFKLPHEVVMRGWIERGQSVRGEIGTYRMEGWSLKGQAGDQFRLGLEPLASYLWQLDVYLPDQDLLTMTMDSDAGYADFTLLDFTLPEDGNYTIVVRAFGTDGEYELKLS